MDEYVPCDACTENGRESPCVVPAGTVCVDCYLRTPQERQDAMQRLREQLELVRESLRDRYAQAALTGMLSSSAPGPLEGRRGGIVRDDGLTREQCWDRPSARRKGKAKSAELSQVRRWVRKLQAPRAARARARSTLSAAA